ERERQREPERATEGLTVHARRSPREERLRNGLLFSHRTGAQVKRAGPSTPPSTGVSGHLDVAVPGDRPAVRTACDFDGALPVAEGKAQLLIGEEGPDVEREPLRGDLEMPARRVAGTARGAGPGRGFGEAEGGRRDRPARAVREDQRRPARRVRAAVAPSQAIEHQLAPVVELEREPVPAHLVGGESAGAPFAIEPGEPGDGEALAAEADVTPCGHPRQRVVVGRLARRRALLRQAPIALEHRRLALIELYVDCSAALLGPEPRGPGRARSEARDRPVVESDAERQRSSAGQAESAAPEALESEEASAFRV